MAPLAPLNDEKDVRNKYPVLGQSVLEGFEGWTGEQDFNTFCDAIRQQNLPAKFLQQEKRDMSNAGQAADDGTPITIGGVVRSPRTSPAPGMST